MTEENIISFRQEGEPAFQPEGKSEGDNSEEKSKTNEDANQTQPDEGDQNSDENKDDGEKEKSKGFIDDPRWKEREEDWKKRFNEQEERHLKSIDDMRTEYDKRFEDVTTKSKGEPKEISQVPSWFGGDEQQWAEFQSWNKGLIDQAEKNAFDKVKAEQSAEQKKIDDATKYFENEVAAIEKDTVINPEAKKVDRNKLLKFVLDNDLVDSQGRWNYRVGFQFMESEIRKAKAGNIDERKRLANATTKDKGGETKESTYKTSDDFADPLKRPW